MRTLPREANVKPDRPLIVSVPCLVAGLGVILGYGNGSSSFAAAYPFSGTILRIDITTVGVGVLGGLMLTLIGLLLLAWSFIASIVSQISLMMGSDTRTERLLE